MTADQAAAILTTTAGKRYYCLRYERQWNVTTDPKGDGCEDLYAKPEDAVQAMVDTVGIVLFPHAWSVRDCLRLLPQCRPDGWLMCVKMSDSATSESGQPQPQAEAAAGKESKT